MPWQRLLSEFAYNLGIYLIACTVVALLIARLARRENYADFVKKGLLVAVALAVMSTLSHYAELHEKGAFRQGSTSNGSTESDRQALSEAERKKLGNRIREIMTGVLKDKDYLTPGIHAEFRELMKRGNISEAELSQYRETGLQSDIDYYRLLYGDALRSLRIGEPYTSQRRKELEKQKLEAGTLLEEVVERNEELVQRIANRKPVEIRGQKVVMTEDRLSRIIKDLDVAEKRLERLFTEWNPDNSTAQ